MGRLRQTLTENKRILVFCARVVVLLVVFHFLNREFFEPSGIHKGLIDILGNSCTKSLALLGYDYTYASSLISLNNEGILKIGNPCDGLSFMILFLSFVIAFPINNLLSKFIFAMIGILTIHILNTIRTILLVLNFTFNPSSFDFNHKYTFVIIVYGIVLWMWMIWAKKNAVKV